MKLNSQVDDYINKQVEWQRPIFEALRQVIHQADSNITEEIKWGAPAFACHGPVAWMFGAKQWVHFSFPQGALLDTPRQGWEEGADTTSKAKRTLKFRQVDDINQTELLSLISQAIGNNKQGKKVDFGAAKPGEKSFKPPAEYQELLSQHGQLELYKTRPYYQQKGWIQWIESAKTEATRQKRIAMMLSELRHGQYMPPKDERHPL